jgi:tetratricopeptide (TPR) repeat protein
MDALKKSATFIKKTGDIEKEMHFNFRLAGFYLLIGDFENAFEYCQRNIQLSGQVIKQPDNRWNKWASGQSFNFMSELYETAGDYETALYYARKAHDHYPKDSASNVVWSAQMGDVFRAMGNHDSALFYLKPFATNIPEPIINAMLTSGTINLCKFYNSLNQYDKSLPLITAIMKRATSATAGWGDGLLVSGNTYFGLKNYQKALNDTRTALGEFRKFLRKERIMDSYKLLSQIFHDLDNNDSAYYYLKQYTVLKDSLFKNQFYFMLNSYKKQAEEERKTSQINLLNKENQLKEQKLKQQAIVKNSLIIGILLLILLGVFIFRNLSLKRKNDKLRSQKDLEMQQLASEKKHAELQQQALELEMQALRAQMNPHFIFNCLNSINRFIFKNETKEASDYLTRFSRLIRMVLLHSQKKLVPLEDELEMLKLYLDMERLRFKNAFDYHITTTNDIENSSVFIPPLLLQPFCENAIWHGLMHKEGPGHLNIELNEDNGILNCIITDDGVGREKAEEYKSKSAEKEKSMGLKITTERLALLNREIGLQTFYEIEDLKDEKGDANGTKVILKISYKESVEEMA